MTIALIEDAVHDVFKEFSKETFIYQLLAAYGKPKASITRLQKGTLNLSKLPGEIIWKKNLLFREVARAKPVPGIVSEARPNLDLHSVTDQLRKSEEVSKHGLRFVVVTDYETLLAVDTKTFDTLDIPLAELPKHFDFFLPWSGQEKHRTHNESQADIKAAYRMAKLYDEICKDNAGMDTTARHSLNVFLSRILFCFFAEDTEIFPKEGMFTSSIASHTQDDGSDLHEYLDKLFEAMNKPDRSSYPAYIESFPYVNGGLFSDKINAPKFSRHSRKVLIECGELDWSEINPDIFGSMIQAVVHPDKRGETGMHYTSVTNIMKVIEPLFLNDLRQIFDENQDNPKALERLRARLSTIKIFDPACGSGNFLIIAFKELRKLEMEIYQRLRELYPQKTLFTFPQIQLTQCCGIEIDDFAHEIAILSLWLAEHQMNVKFKQNLGILVPALPLKASGHIVCGNATRLEWEKVCPKDEKSEIYVLGNPPYLGSSNQDNMQKADMSVAFSGVQNYKNLDYIACWFFKGAEYIQGVKARLAFVSTNSICQGEQVEMLWPHLLGRGLEIAFAHLPFKWTNNAKHNAGVTVAIIGLRNSTTGPKHLFLDRTFKVVENIGPYLAPGKNLIVKKRSKPLSNLPEMTYGSKPVDDGNFFLTADEKAKILASYPLSEKFIKKAIGSSEFIRGFYRWCIWVNDADAKEALAIPPFKDRFDKIKKFRMDSTKEATNDGALYAYRFGEPRYAKGHSILIPRHSSERREYLPFGFLDNDTVVLDSAQAIYDPETWVLGVISSRMHNVWVRAVAGRIRTDIRYSSVLCYNTFPIVELTPKMQETITTHVFNILTEVEKHPEKSMTDLYDPDLMPSGLLQAHRDLDAAIERCYRSKPFSTDEERLQYLFGLYEEMVHASNNQKGKIHA